MEFLRRRVWVIGSWLLAACVASGCAGFNDFLEIPLDHGKPLLLFPSAVTASESDTLVLLAMADAEAYVGVEIVTLRFYVEDTESELAIVRSQTDKKSRFLPFEQINLHNAAAFKDDFPALEEPTIFGMYLEGMKVDIERLNSYKKISDGEYRNVRSRGARMLDEREVHFAAKPISKEQAQQFRSLVNNTFHIEGKTLVAGK